MSETEGYGHGHVTGQGSYTKQGAALGEGIVQVGDDGYGNSFVHVNGNGGGYDDGKGYGYGAPVGAGTFLSFGSNGAGYG